MKEKKFFFIILGLIFVLLVKLEFFKNSYFLINKSFNERFITAYEKDYFSGFCSKESHGYIKYIKNKFQLKKSPKIVNFSEERVKLPYWIFYKNKKKINENELILVNLKSKNNFNFDNYIIKDNFNNSCFYLIKN